MVHFYTTGHNFKVAEVVSKEDFYKAPQDKRCQVCARHLSDERQRELHGSPFRNKKKPDYRPRNWSTNR